MRDFICIAGAEFRLCINYVICIDADRVITCIFSLNSYDWSNVEPEKMDKLLYNHIEEILNEKALSDWKKNKQKIEIQKIEITLI